MILVAGGTGTLGSRLVERLAARGLSVRVLTRDARRVSSGAHVEAVEADVRDPASLVGAMQGVDTVVSAVQGFAGSRGETPASVDRDGNAHLMEAAAAVGASFVLISGVGVAPDSPMELFRMKHAAEECLRASSVAWTIVRPTAFLETWIALLEQTLNGSGRPLVFGRGDNPINFVSVIDVATLVERIVVDTSTRYQTLEIGGPQNLTLNQLAAVVQQAAGRADGPRHVPRTVLRVLAVALLPFKPALARQVQAALTLDTGDFVFDGRARSAAYPAAAQIPFTCATEALRLRPSNRRSAAGCVASHDHKGTPTTSTPAVTPGATRSDASKPCRWFSHYRRHHPLNLRHRRRGRHHRLSRCSRRRSQSRRRWRSSPSRM